MLSLVERRLRVETFHRRIYADWHSHGSPLQRSEHFQRDGKASWFSAVVWKARCGPVDSNIGGGVGTDIIRKNFLM